MAIESRARQIVAGAALLVSLVPAIALAAPQDPFYDNYFGGGAEALEAWTLASGNWQVASGRLKSAGSGATSLAFVHTYDTNLRDDKSATIGEHCFVDTVVQLLGTAANARAGIVFDFSDPGNFNEVTFRASGEAQLRRTVGGVSSTVAVAPFASPGLGKWMHVSVTRSNERTLVKVDGAVVFDNVPQQGSAGSLVRVGLIARNGPALFDSFHADSIGTQQPFVEDWNDGESDLAPLSGNWALQSNTWVSTAAVATAFSVSDLHEIWGIDQTVDFNYAIKVRMRNGYANSGNLVGLAWLASTVGDDYTEVVFSPKGQASVNTVENGVRTVVASAPYAGGGQNRWFDVEVAYSPGDSEGERGSIKVNGVTVFDIPISVFTGAPALVTHWALARFDDFRAERALFDAISDFPDASSSNFLGRFHSINPDWAVQNGAVRNSVGAQTSRARLPSWHQFSDIDYRVRMVNHYGSSGNLVGLVYGNDDEIDQYYEVVFSPTGVARLNRVLAGVTYPVATASYAGGGAHQWFDVRLTQRNLHTTVEVNGVPVFQNVLQPDSVGGRMSLGFVTHWASAEFDEVSLTELPP